VIIIGHRSSDPLIIQPETPENNGARREHLERWFYQLQIIPLPSVWSTCRPSISEDRQQVLSRLLADLGDSRLWANIDVDFGNILVDADGSNKVQDEPKGCGNLPLYERVSNVFLEMRVWVESRHIRRWFFADGLC
jgi:hypothetical protein